MVAVNYAPTLAASPGPSPEALALQQEYAKHLLAGNDQPIHSWSQGLAGIVDALVGGTMARKAGEKQAAGEASAADQFSQLLMGGGVQPGGTYGGGPEAEASAQTAFAGAQTPSSEPSSEGDITGLSALPVQDAAPAPAAAPLVSQSQIAALLRNPFATPAQKAMALELWKAQHPAPKAPEEYTLKPNEHRFIGGREIASVPGEAPTPPDAVQQYQFAVSQGYKGTFQDWQTEADARKRTPAAGTDDIQEYNFAKEQGYNGTFEQWQKQKQTATIQEYNLAKQQGYTGTLHDYQLELAKAGAAKLGAGAMETAMVKRYTDITDAGNAASEAVAVFDRMGQLAKDPNFVSGAGANPLLFIKQGIAALGGDPNAAAPMEEFAGLSHKVAIASMGGSLGTGFSSSDRDYVDSQMPTLDTSLQGNLARIEINRRIAERKVLIAEKADEYVLEHGNLDAGFNKEMKEFARANPLFADLPNAGGLKTISDPAAALKLPPGTHFLTPDGREKVVPKVVP